MASGVLQAAIKSRKPGDRLTVTYRRRGGATGTTTITLKEDPSLEAVTLESTGATLTPDQKAFRESWLGPKAKP
jgi:PDZ domain-containing secreted protein